MSKSLKTLAIGAEWILLGIFFSKIMGYIYRLIIARMGASEYGVISLGITLMTILPTIAVMGLDLGILRYTSFYKAKGDEKRTRGSIISSILVSSILSIIMFFVLFFSSDKIALMFFGDISLGYIIKILSITLPFYVLARIFLASIRAFEKVRYVVYSEYFIENVLKIITVLILIYTFSLGMIGAAIAHVVAIISVAVSSIYFFNKKVFNLFNRNFTLVTRKMLSYSWPLMLGTLSGALLAWVDNLMIGYLLKDSVQIGIYNAASPTAMMMLISNYAFLSLFTPIMSKLLAVKDKTAMNSIYRSVTKWTFLINFPLFLIMFFLSKDIIRILFGEAYVAGWSSLSVLVIGYLIYTILFASRNVLEVFKKTKLVMINIVFILGINIVLNYFLILKYGILGAAIATSFSLILIGLMFLTEVIIIKRVNPLNLGYVKFLLINLFCFFITYKILNLILEKTVLYFVLFGVIFLVMYLTLLIKLKCFTEEELDLIKSFKSRIF